MEVPGFFQPGQTSELFLSTGLAGHKTAHGWQMKIQLVYVM
jgi:hypothetical protein